MTDFDSMQTPQEMDLLVAFFDLTRFLSYSQSHTAHEMFDFFSSYAEFVGDIIEGAGGKVVKFIGDAGLIVFPADKIDQGVLALIDLKTQGDQWLADHDVASRNVIQAHFGPVVAGPLGTRHDKRFDVMGQTVNIAATTKSNGIALTPQLFRKLAEPTRKFFKKHTPPITYIPVGEHHNE
jgi:adenylate cyclase